MTMLRDLSSGGSAPPNVPEAVEQAMTRMEDPAAVAWAPKFAAALIATTETEPRARTTVRAVCLDMWQSHTHQCAPAPGVLFRALFTLITPLSQSSADFNAIQVVASVPLCAWCTSSRELERL